MNGTEDQSGHAVRAQRAKEYFGQPGFERVLAGIWGKYSTFGRAGGHIKLPNLSADECERLNGFFGWNLKAGEDKRVSLKAFEEELEDSPFPSTIPELYLALTGEPLRTKEELRELQSLQWSRLFEPAFQLLENHRNLQQLSELELWLSAVRAGRAHGYRTVREVYRTSSANAEHVILQACRGLLYVLNRSSELPETRGRIRLPVLAGRITGDSHAFDLRNPAGRLLWIGLQALQSGGGSGSGPQELELPADEGKGAPELPFLPDSLQIREVYRGAGIADDDVSSFVHVYWGLPGHPALLQVLTLRQVEAMELEQALAARQIYMVENPSVFSALIDIAEELAANGKQGREQLPPLLICTSGQPSLACLQLVRRVLNPSNSFSRLYYSGDFDVKGLEMGRQLATLFPGQFVPWRFDSRTYLNSRPQGPEFSTQEQERLAAMEITWDPELAGLLMEQGTKCYQETFIELLIKDWLNSLENGDTGDSPGKAPVSE